MHGPQSRQRAARLFLCGAFLLAGPLTARAEDPSPSPATATASTPESSDTGDLEALLGESVVTTASRSAERASLAPATVFNIGGDQMMRAGLRTVDEALEYLGLGIYVNKVRDYATGSDVGAQGILLRDGGARVLVMLDGMILNSQGTGRISVNEALGVPLEIIDHIEVMLGPGSVSYGSNAMLAVINIIPKRAKDLNGVHASVELGTATPMNDHGGFTSGGESNFGLRYRLSLDAGARFKIGNTDGEVTAMVEWTHENSNSYAIMPFGRGPIGNHSFLPDQAQWGGTTFHTLATPNGIVAIKLGQFRLTVNAFDYERTTPLTGTFADPGSREHQTGVRAELRNDWDLTSKLSLSSRVYTGYASFYEASNYGESFWCPAGMNYGCTFRMGARSEWVGMEQQLAINWLKTGTVKTIFGYDARLRIFDGRSADYHDLMTGAGPTDVASPHSTDTSFVGALFVQQTWQATRWLSLNVGARLDIDSDFGVDLSPRAAIVITPADGTVLRASYNQAFRAPSTYEQTESDPTYRISPRSLSPETVKSVELELQQRLWRFALAVRGYATFYDNLIDSRSATAAEVQQNRAQLSSSAMPGNVVVNDNLDALHVYGGSASVQLHLPRGFDLGYTFNIARTAHPDGTVDQRLPFWFGNFQAGWRSSDDGYSVMLTGVYTSAREVLYNSLPQSFPNVGSRVDLRLAAAGPLGRVVGLTWRAVVGGSTEWQQPYALAIGAPIPNGYVLYPIQTRLFGFVGIRYQFAGF